MLIFRIGPTRAPATIDVMVARVERVLNQFTDHAPPFWVDVPAFTAFAAEVTDVLQAGELPFAARQALLRRAAHHGLRRFDANLIIAMVQNRVGEKRIVSEPNSRRSWLFPVTIAAAIQAIIGLAIFILVHG